MEREYSFGFDSQRRDSSETSGTRQSFFFGVGGSGRSPLESAAPGGVRRAGLYKD